MLSCVRLIFVMVDNSFCYTYVWDKALLGLRIIQIIKLWETKKNLIHLDSFQVFHISKMITEKR